MLNKKGLNQIDWVISMAIFLLYIIWYFVFITPKIEIVTDLSPLQDIVKTNFEEDTNWEIYKTPIFLKSEKNKTNAPVFVNFTPTYGQHSFLISNNKDYFFENNKLLLLQDFENNSDFLEMIQCNISYLHSNSRMDINKVNDTLSTSRQLSVDFHNGLPKNISYKNSIKLLNSIFSLNGNTFNQSDYNFTDYGILSEYKLNTQSININSRIIAGNSIMWFTIERNDDDTSNNLILTLSNDDFDYYFSDNNKNGDLLSDSCETYTNDYFKMYDSANSVSFILTNDTEISFCYNMSDVSLNLTIPINSDVEEFFIIFDNEEYSESDFIDYTVKFGLKDKINGIDYSSFSGMDYNYLKNKWGYPNTREFQIIVWNTTFGNLENRSNSEILEIGETPYTQKEVYAKEFRDFILDENGNLGEVTVNIKTW